MTTITSTLRTRTSKTTNATPTTRKVCTNHLSGHHHGDWFECQSKKNNKTVVQPLNYLFIYFNFLLIIDIFWNRSVDTQHVVDDQFITILQSAAKLNSFLSSKFSIIDKKEKNWFKLWKTHWLQDGWLKMSCDNFIKLASGNSQTFLVDSSLTVALLF